jgi:phosphosulfolactate synthase
MIDHLHQLGLTGVELSENYIELTTEERLREIERLQKGGLKVVYEFGRKNPIEPMSFDYVAGLVDEVARLGIDHITVEQCEIDLLAKTSSTALAELQRQPWFEHMLIEVDPYRFPQQHAQIIKDFGPEVNLANVTPGQILRLEGFRCGIGRAVDYSLLAR